jgi:holin-like protein
LLQALTVLVVCQFAGELAAQMTGVPIPGPVLGMLLLLGGLIWREHAGRKGPDAELKAAAHGLLGNLSLLFVPAGVGVVAQLDVLAKSWLPLTVAIVVSTFLGLLVTGWVMQHLADPADR